MDLTKSTNALLQKVSAEEKLPPKVGSASPDVRTGAT